MKHGGVVLTATFSPDGARIATASGDRTARIWDVATGRELLRLQRDSVMFQVGFAPDGNRVVTAADDAARAWDVEELALTAPSLLQRACTWLPASEGRFDAEEIASDPLIRDVFLSGGRSDRSVCEGFRK